MKPGIHPTWYPDAVVTCACGNTFTTGSTKKEIHTDICSNCHPFYTGEARIVDTAGQVERFMKRAGAKDKIAAARPAPEEKPAKKEKRREEKRAMPVLPTSLPLAAIEEKPVEPAPEPPVVQAPVAQEMARPEPVEMRPPAPPVMAPIAAELPTPPAAPVFVAEPVAERMKKVEVPAGKPVHHGTAKRAVAKKAPAAIKPAAGPRRAPKAAKPKAAAAKPKAAAKKPAAKKKK